MNNLKVGIVGLPNAGKSTLFNALAARRLAETAPRPFTTIESHEAVVPLPDSDLDKLSNFIRPGKTVPATVTFIDIAGLVKGAHKGEGLGNQFLGKIREVNAIVHVVRAFENPEVVRFIPDPGSQSSTDPGSEEQILEDIEVVNIELELGGIVGKPLIYVLNVDEDKINDVSLISAVEEKFKEKAVTICAKLEEELIDFSEAERKEYLKQVGVEETGLERLILHAYELLDLITFYTIKGGKEVSAWSLKRGANVIEAAAKVHTDFAKNFIKAEVISVNQLLEFGNWKEAKDKGLIKLEGKDYAVQDKDVIEFKVSA